MNNMPKKLKAAIDADLDYRYCARYRQDDHECDGRITMEHAVTYKGRQVQKKWAVVPLCTKAHSVDQFQDGGDFDKEINLWIAVNQATDEELLDISKAKNYFAEQLRLNEKYGRYRREYPIVWGALPSFYDTGSN